MYLFLVNTQDYLDVTFVGDIYCIKLSSIFFMVKDAVQESHFLVKGCLEEPLSLVPA